MESKQFEKLKKRFALSNSYFKNRQSSAPSDPFEILDYVKQHGELPYNSEKTEYWFYDCFCEFQKRNGVFNSQFFTPPKTAERIAEVALRHKDIDELVLDACCGFGQLTKSLKKLGFTQIHAFDIDQDMASACFDLTNIDAKRFDYKDGERFSDNYNLIVSNPPYEVASLSLFLEFVLEHLNENGIAILLIPNGFLDKQRPSNLVKILNKFAIIDRELMKEKFERTAINAEIVTLIKV